MASKTFFPRGSGPLVSFLLPTRGRSGGLLNTVKSIYNITHDKSNIEFLLRVDEDDFETEHVAYDLIKEYGEKVIKLTVKPRGRGYADLHLMVNELASQALGDWLFLINDDCEIVTPNYDSVVLNLSTYNKYPGVSDVCLLQFQQVEDLRSYSFIALRRKSFEILKGLFSRFPHCDLWLFQVMNCLDAVLPVPVQVSHDQKVSIDITGRQGVQSVVDIWREMKLPYVFQQRLNDAQKLLNHIVLFRSRMKWIKVPNSSGWYWWRKLAYTPEIPMLVFLDSKKYEINVNGAIINLVGGDVAIGPEPGSDCVTKIYSVKSVGGEWSEFQ